MAIWDWNVAVQALDGEFAFNIGADGRATRAGTAAATARRIDTLAHPVVLVRAISPISKPE